MQKSCHPSWCERTAVAMRAGDGCRSVGQLPFFTAADRQGALIRTQFQSSGGGMALAAACLVLPAQAQEPIKLGLVAAMSGQSAKSGEAIVRGLSLAIDEINL